MVQGCFWDSSGTALWCNVFLKFWLLRHWLEKPIGNATGKSWNLIILRFGIPSALTGGPPDGNFGHTFEKVIKCLAEISKVDEFLNKFSQNF